MLIAQYLFSTKYVYLARFIFLITNKVKSIILLYSQYCSIAQVDFVKNSGCIFHVHLEVDPSQLSIIHLLSAAPIILVTPHETQKKRLGVRQNHLKIFRDFSSKEYVCDGPGGCFASL